LAKPASVLKKGALASGPPLERHTTQCTFGMRHSDSNFKRLSGPNFTSEDSDDSLEDDGVDDVLRKHGHGALGSKLDLPSPQRSPSPSTRSNSQSPNFAMTEGMNARLRMRRKRQEAENAPSVEISKAAASSSAIPGGDPVVSLDAEISKLPSVSSASNAGAASSKGFGRVAQKSRTVVPEDPSVASQMLDFHGAEALRLSSSNSQRRKQPTASKASALPQLTPRSAGTSLHQTSNDVNSDTDQLFSRQISSKSQPAERVTFNGVPPSREGPFPDIKRTASSKDAPPRITGSSNGFAAFRGNKGANGPASARK
jgi:hypothetical protein